MRSTSNEVAQTEHRWPSPTRTWNEKRSAECLQSFVPASLKWHGKLTIWRDHYIFTLTILEFSHLHQPAEAASLTFTQFPLHLKPDTPPGCCQVCSLTDDILETDVFCINSYYCKYYPKNLKTIESLTTLTNTLVHDARSDWSSSQLTMVVTSVRHKRPKTKILFNHIQQRYHQYLQELLCVSLDVFSISPYRLSSFASVNHL